MDDRLSDGGALQGRSGGPDWPRCAACGGAVPYQHRFNTSRPHRATLRRDCQGVVPVDAGHPGGATLPQEEGGGGVSIGKGEAGAHDRHAQEPGWGKATAWVNDVLTALVGAAGGDGHIPNREHRGDAIGPLWMTDPQPPRTAWLRPPSCDDVTPRVDEEGTGPGSCKDGRRPLHRPTLDQPEEIGKASPSDVEARSEEHTSE